MPGIVKQQLQVSSEDDYEDLVLKARSQGRIAVIVKFGVSSPALPELTRDQQETRIREIQQIQQQILNSLKESSSFSNVKLFTYSPYFGITVDESALSALKANPLVLDITEDSSSPPN